MKKSEVWGRLKADETQVYGRPIMDVFLDVVNDLDPSHIKDLDARQLKILNPDIRLSRAGSVEEAAAAMKDGAKNLYAAVRGAVSRDNMALVDFILDRGEEMDENDDTPDFASLLHVAVEGACESASMDMIKKLVNRAQKCGADCVDERGILSSAAVSGRKEVFEYLCDRGYDDKTEPEELLALAIRVKSARVARKCLSGVDDDALAELMDFAYRKSAKEIGDLIGRDLGWED